MRKSWFLVFLILMMLIPLVSAVEYRCPDPYRDKDGDINKDGNPDWFYGILWKDDFGNKVELWGIDKDAGGNGPYFAFIVKFADYPDWSYLAGKCPFEGGINRKHITHETTPAGKTRLTGTVWNSADEGKIDEGLPGRDMWTYTLKITWLESGIPVLQYTERYYDGVGKLIKEINMPIPRWPHSPGDFNDLDPVIPGFSWSGDPMIFEGEAVGGVVVSVNRFELITPYIGLSSTLAVATVATAVYIKRVKHRKEKQ